MKKQICIFALLLLAFAVPAFASLKIYSGGTNRGEIHKLDTAGGITITSSGGKGTITASMLSAVDAVASGQTSKAVTLTGVTASSKCFASLMEVATASISIRAVVPTTNTVTVTVSGDPGVSNADLSVLCIG